MPHGPLPTPTDTTRLTRLSKFLFKLARRTAAPGAPIGEEQVDYGRRRDTRFRHCAQSLLVLERLVARHAMVPAALDGGTHTGLDDVLDADGRVR